MGMLRLYEIPLAIVTEFLGVTASALEVTLSYNTEILRVLCKGFFDPDGATDNRDDLAKTLCLLGH